jgi:hypothetical protein
VAHPIIARIGEYTQAEAYLQDGLDLAFTGGLHPGAYGFGILDAALVGQVFGVNVGDFDVDADTVDEQAADLLLVAGDSFGGTAALFDGVALEAARAGVQIAVTVGFFYLCCTFATSSGPEAYGTLQENTRKVVCCPHSAV